MSSRLRANKQIGKRRRASLGMHLAMIQTISRGTAGAMLFTASGSPCRILINVEASMSAWNAASPEQ
jgi:hypothetical protein